MVSITYKQFDYPAVTEVFVDRRSLSGKLGIDPRTLRRWFREGRVSLGRYGTWEWAVISEEVYVYGSNRGCPKGENRFIKKR